MTTLYDLTTKQPVVLSAREAEEAVKAGTHAFGVNDTLAVVDQSGKAFDVSAQELQEALKRGYSLETPEQAAVREYVKDNKGIAGALKVGVGQAVDEFALGIPELIYDNTADPLDRAKKDALKKEHDLANTLGGVAGFGASLLTPVGPARLVGSAANTVGRAAGKAAAAKASAVLGEKVSEKALGTIFTNAVGKAAEMGVESALFSTPRAITEAALGKPEDAAETLLISLGAGAVIGGVGSGGWNLAKLGVNKAKQLGTDALKNSSKFALSRNKALVETLTETPDTIIREEVGSVSGKQAIDEYVERVFNERIGSEAANTLDRYASLAQKQIDDLYANLLELDEKLVGLEPGTKSYETLIRQRGELGKELQFAVQERQDLILNQHIRSHASNALEKPLEILGAGAGLEYAVPGLGKLYGAYKLASKVGETLQNPHKLVDGILAVEEAQKLVARQLDRVKPAIENLYKRTGGAARPASVVSLRELLGDEHPKDKASLLDGVVSRLSAVVTSPEAMTTNTAPVSDFLSNGGAPVVASSFVAQANKVAQHLIDKAPKAPAPTNFLNQYKWQPSDSEMAAFERRVSVAVNPFSVIDDLENGSLTREQVETLAVLYPSLYGRIKAAALKVGSQMGSKRMPYQNQVKLSLLLDMPVTPSLLPHTVLKLQKSFVPQPAMQQKPKNINVPSLMTNSQRLQGR